MLILGLSNRLPGRPDRVLVGGTSGSGKSTLAKAIGSALGLPYTEIDVLHHGPQWTVRSTFIEEVEALAAQPRWITEYQYSEARPILLASCDLVVYLALPRAVVMRRVIARTIRRSLRREVLWNGNTEPPLRTLLTDPDHVIRWAWKTHGLSRDRIEAIRSERPDLPLIVLRTPREVAAWLRQATADQLT